MKTNLLLIDPNTDFHDSNVVNHEDSTIYSPALPVPGSTEDAHRISSFLNSSLGNELNKIYVSLDKHSVQDISHTVYWKTNDSSHPEPYTQITYADVKEGLITTSDPSKKEHALNYLKALESSNGSHWVFPIHCVSDSVGYRIFPLIREALDNWAIKNNPENLFIFDKGENPDYEFFSPFGAEVVDEKSPDTGFNQGLVSQILECDKLYICGQALSHCVLKGLEDIVNYLEFSASDETEARSSLSKVNLVINMSSPVSGFEEQAKLRLDALEKKGINLISL